MGRNKKAPKAWGHSITVDFNPDACLPKTIIEKIEAISRMQFSKENKRQLKECLDDFFINIELIDRGVRRAEQKKSIEEFVKRARLFAEALERIDIPSYRKIRDQSPGWLDKKNTLHYVQHFIFAAEDALNELSPDKGGQPSYDSLSLLLSKLLPIFESVSGKYFDKQIPFDEDKGGSYGDLLDFVYTCLTESDINFQSKEALAKRLNRIIINRKQADE